MFGGIRNRRRGRVSSRNTAASRRTARMPKTLPSSVVFSEIDYDGEHMDLAVPIVADFSLDEEGDVLLVNEETSVYGVGPTLEDAMEDFCGSFLLCYRIMIKYGPGTKDWNQIMLHVYGWRRIRTD